MLVTQHVPGQTAESCLLLGQALYLLHVSLSEGQLGGNMEHDLLLSVDGVDGVGPRLTVGNIQAPPKPEQGQRVRDD